MRILAFLSLCLLCACQTVKPYESPTQNYVLNGENLRIVGRMEQNIITGQNRLLVTINGVPAIDGVLPSGYSGEVVGSYNRHSVVALCSSEQKSPNWIDVRCPILIDETRTVTLTF